MEEHFNHFKILSPTRNFETGSKAAYTIVVKLPFA